ncbi:hypothetical protein ACNHYB_01565 [Isoptericola jiangsuensis]|uniref:hypothetical protein n=1 Tax=Isoptericola jiangsuensis TaxID=548579 RepID=UPI003AAFADBA
MQTDTALTIPADAVARDALLHRLRALAGLDHPSVEPVGATVARPDGTLVVPRGAEHATDMATILSVRGRLTVPEASGLAVDLAQGLAALHSDGIVQGPLDPGDVVLGLDGRACLRPRLELPPPGTAPGDDVQHLARLVTTVVGPEDGDDLVALRAALAPALADDVRVRPEAGTLAARVHDAVPPEQVRVPEPAVLAAAALARRPPSTVPETATHRRARRPVPDRTTEGRLPAGRSERRAAARSARTVARRHPWAGRGRRVGLAVGGVVAAVAVMVVGGLQLAGPPTAPAIPAAAASPVTGSGLAGSGVADVVPTVLDREDPAAAAVELTLRRVAILTGDTVVDDVAQPGSPAHHAASQERERAQEIGTRVVGAEAEVTGVRTTSDVTAGGTSDVEIDYVIGAHEQVSPEGSVLEVPRSEPRTDTLRLVWTDEGWRVTEVL